MKRLTSKTYSSRDRTHSRGIDLVYRHTLRGGASISNLTSAAHGVSCSAPVRTQRCSATGLPAAQSSRPATLAARPTA